MIEARRHSIAAAGKPAGMNRRSPCPWSEPVQRPLKRILLATDLSELSAAAHERGLETAAAVFGSARAARSLLVVGPGSLPAPLPNQALARAARAELASSAPAGVWPAASAASNPSGGSAICSSRAKWGARTSLGSRAASPTGPRSAVAAVSRAISSRCLSRMEDGIGKVVSGGTAVADTSGRGAGPPVRAAATIASPASMRIIMVPSPIAERVPRRPWSRAGRPASPIHSIRFRRCGYPGTVHTQA
jgi:hypothetical protein